MLNKSWANAIGRKINSIKKIPVICRRMETKPNQTDKRNFIIKTN